MLPMLVVKHITLEVIFCLAFLHRVEIMAFSHLLVEMHNFLSIQVSQFTYLFSILASIEQTQFKIEFSP